MASRSDGSMQLNAEALSKLALYARVDTLHVVSITARASLPDGASFARRAVVAVSPDRPLEPTRILRWEQPADLSPGNEISLR